MDKHLMFEHMLREHVNVQLQRIEDALAAAGVGEHSRTVDLYYKANDGGVWKISKYFAKGEVNFTAAELEAAVNGWIALYEAQNRAKVLRSMIASPQRTVDDDNIPF